MTESIEVVAFVFAEVTGVGLLPCGSVRALLHSAAEAVTLLDPPEVRALDCPGVTFIEGLVFVINDAGGFRVDYNGALTKGQSFRLPDGLGFNRARTRQSFMERYGSP